MAIERSLNIIKPSALDRNLAGRILQRFEDKGLKIVGMKMCLASEALIKAAYSDNAEEDWFPSLVQYMTSGPIIVFCLEGENANAAARQVIGKKDPMKSAAGSIRGDFNISKVTTVVHGSRTPEEAEKEIAVWFGKDGPEPEWDLIEPTGEEKKRPVGATKAMHPIDPTREAQ